jgi:hypothetical protein
MQEIEDEQWRQACRYGPRGGRGRLSTSRRGIRISNPREASGRRVTSLRRPVDVGFRGCGDGLDLGSYATSPAPKGHACRRTPRRRLPPANLRLPARPRTVGQHVCQRDSENQAADAEGDRTGDYRRACRDPAGVGSASRDDPPHEKQQAPGSHHEGAWSEATADVSCSKRGPFGSAKARDSRRREALRQPRNPRRAGAHRGDATRRRPTRDAARGIGRRLRDRERTDRAGP